jgi:hypothetical protein
MENLQFTPEKNSTTMLIKEKTTSISRAFLVIRMLFFTTVIALSVLIATGIIS